MRQETASARATRLWLAWLTGLTAVCAAAGAAGLATGALDLGPVAVARLPLHSTGFAGAALALVVAVPMAVAAYLAARARRGHPVAATAAGLLLIGWLAVEVALIREFSWLQVLFGAVAVAVLLLAAPVPKSAKPLLPSR